MLPHFGYPSKTEEQVDRVDRVISPIHSNLFEIEFICESYTKHMLSSMTEHVLWFKYYNNHELQICFALNEDNVNGLAMMSEVKKFNIHLHNKSGDIIKSFKAESANNGMFSLAGRYESNSLMNAVIIWDIEE